MPPCINRHPCRSQKHSVAQNLCGQSRVVKTQYQAAPLLGGAPRQTMAEQTSADDPGSMRRKADTGGRNCRKETRGKIVSSLCHGHVQMIQSLYVQPHTCSCRSKQLSAKVMVYLFHRKRASLHSTSTTE